jgi:hypothetical protein
MRTLAALGIAAAMGAGCAADPVAPAPSPPARASFDAALIAKGFPQSVTAKSARPVHPARVKQALGV